MKKIKAIKYFNKLDQKNNDTIKMMNVMKILMKK